MCPGDNEGGAATRCGSFFLVECRLIRGALASTRQRLLEPSAWGSDRYLGILESRRGVVLVSNYGLRGQKKGERARGREDYSGWIESELGDKLSCFL